MTDEARLRALFDAYPTTRLRAMQRVIEQLIWDRYWNA